jgi:hypothetical protein
VPLVQAETEDGMMETGHTHNRFGVFSNGSPPLRRALSEYILHLARARHFAFHPDARPTDGARADAHLDAARRAEATLRALLEGAPTGTGVEDAPDGSGGPDGALIPRQQRLARRLEAGRVAERCLRLLERAEVLATHPYPLDADGEVAAGQLEAAGRARLALHQELRDLALAA